MTHEWIAVLNAFGDYCGSASSWCPACGSYRRCKRDPHTMGDCVFEYRRPQMDWVQEEFPCIGGGKP